jgi:hypothetical protein
MAQSTAAQTAAAVDRTIHDVGSTCMIDEETTGRWKSPDRSVITIP